jgi:DNA-binding winged helix-turn-helix (wHTH) protein/tetratricopeptide (TPR) repeat protein
MPANMPSPGPVHDVLRFGPHWLDLRRQQLWTGAAPVALQPKAWALLLYLLQRPGMLVSTDELLNALWPQAEVTPKALTNRIVELRKALGDDPRAPRLIQTVHRRGYRLLTSVNPGEGPHEMAAMATAAERAAPHAPDGAIAPRVDSTGLAGRDTDQAALAHHWALAVQGRRQVVLLAGESGIGKTSLAEAFAQAVLAVPGPHTSGRNAADPAAGVVLGRGASLQQSAEREAFGSLLALVGDLASGPEQALVVPLLRRYAPTWLLQLPWLSDEAETAQWRHSLAGAGTGRMLREGCAFFEMLSQQRPVLLLLEDLHWTDPATIDLLDQLAQGRRPARLMVLGTLQPALALQAQHPVLARSRRLLAQGQLTERRLGPLTLPDVQAHLAARFGSDALAQALAARVMRASGGHPLFLTAMIDHLVAAGRLRHGVQGWALVGDGEQTDWGVPEQLRQLIAAGVAQLDTGQRALLEAASVVGMQVSAQALAAALGQALHEVEQACQALAQRQQWLLSRPASVWPDGTLAGAWTFVHDIHRQVLYDAIAPARRQLLHRRVAERLAQGWGERVAEQAGTLAAAYEQAGMPEATARMLELVAGVCTQRYAYAEAVDAINAALSRLAQLPESPDRNRHEIRLHLRHGSLLMALRGPNFPQALRALQAAEALSLRLGDVRKLMHARLGICMHHLLCGWVSAAARAGESLVALAQAQQPALLAAASAYAGMAELLAGRAESANDHFMRTLSLESGPAVQMLLDLHALAGVQRVRCLLALKRPQEASRQLEEAMAHARRACVPMDLIQNLFWSADCLCQLDRAGEAAALLDELMALAEAQAQPHFRIAGEVCRLGLAPPAQRDLARMDALVQQLLGSGDRWCDAKVLALLAETRQAQGDPAGARQALAQAEAVPEGMPVYADAVLNLAKTAPPCLPASRLGRAA